MDKAPLVMDEIEAGAAFIKRLHDYAPVKAAWWMRTSEDAERYLRAALEGLNVSNSGLAYMEVLRITKDMKDHYIDPFRVKVVSTNDPTAKAIMDIYRRLPPHIRPRLNETVLGAVAFADIYIYPQHPAKP